MSYGDPREISASLAQMLRKSARLTPSQAAAKYLRTEKGPYDDTLAPMLREPLDYLGTRDYRGIIYVGPARASKSFSLIMGSLVYIVMCAPGDTQITHISRELAREFSVKDLDRTLRHSTEVGGMLSTRASDDNVFDKAFANGMLLSIAWPTPTQHAAKTLRYVLITDYDRPANVNDVGGEGSLFGLAQTRTTTYMSRGKTLAESSPGGEYDPRGWRQGDHHEHEAPPAVGILALYNNGTQARLYWPCFHCGEYFHARPGLECFSLPPFEEIKEQIHKLDFVQFAEQHAFVKCSHCAGVHRMDQKREMNLRSRWVHRGESIAPNGKISGDRLRTDIVSYWQGGVSAAYQSWAEILLKYLQGIHAYAMTGEEGQLKKTTNTDQAMPYVPVALRGRRDQDLFVSRVEDWPRGLVPAGVQFITQSVDLQKNAFIVHAMGWGEGGQWLLDRWKITGSQRVEGNSFAAIDPASYLEDWDALIAHVIMRQYPMADDTSSVMRPVATFCDSGGRAGATNNAYDFWRKLHRGGLGNRFRLVKGASSPDAPRWEQTFPDSRGRTDRNSNARGDVPVYMLNTNVFKDALDAAIKRTQPGPNFLHVPRWIDPEFWKEVTAEERDPHTRRWKGDNNHPNHATDLDVYARAGAVILGLERINWANPPIFCGPEKREQSTPARPPRGRGVRDGGVEL